MLTRLQILNYVLIDSLDIGFGRDFSVLTGETGAGKSIILGALNLLMGQRAENRVIRTGADKCMVEGHFDLTGYGLEALFTQNDLDYDEKDTIIRREVSASGKSRAFINDTPVTLNQLREIGSCLIDIHSQHQNLVLGTEAFQTALTDAVAGNSALLESYRQAYSECKEASASLEKLKEEAAQSIQEQEFLRFQYDELADARLEEGEQESLEEELDILSHSEDIKEALYQAAGILDSDEGGVVQSVRQALNALREASRNLPMATELSQRLDSCLIDLKDISAEISKAEEDTVYDPKRLEQVGERLDLIYSLEKKHRMQSVTELLEYQSEIGAKLGRIDSYDNDIQELEARLKQLEKERSTRAAKVTESRRKAAAGIEKDICSMLAPLGIPNVRLKIEISPRGTFDRSGADCVAFMFSANKSTPLQELSQVASGGEISRVMLCVKSLLAGVRSLPTMVLDEIDTGVSGAVAEKMAIMMKDMCADGHQVIAITHLPQIAAKADAQYLVSKTDDKDGTRTGIGLLDREQRVTEIAKMMSGSVLTSAALDNARSLLEN